ncbi:Rho GTPase activation protein [Fomitiporia mediterranea MF3/22]|uniref:Rho GTPase activation protein n=1 Tax=Fomitiporia mediterranea (strain MF3/22) TaxID=694068 RepID=UPI000440979B|nr:Rho GTPase activation protein [Fomitiporia mediterranea MF3/22]EJD06884.1 Rho GTPase activation protein [Fomitiporia mediterranea MF3/22]
MIHATHVPHSGSGTDLPRDGAASPPPPPLASLKSWWSQFKRTKGIPGAVGQKELQPGYGYGYTSVKDDGPHPVFGAPLHESLKYAAVQISTANSNGELYVWGDIPVVVAKCGLYLKENATEVEGTFRVSGSNKRMRDLQALFETPPKYGKNLDWKKENYTPHDVASVFRRYLTQMPEPVIPYNLYGKFREALTKKLSTDEVIKAYKQLIRSMPPQNQYLLLYVLDLLSVFARKSDKNLMTASSLAIIFRPGIINHPSHELSHKEHALSQEVLEFLIEHQDWFMLDVPPPPPPPKSPLNQNSSNSQVPQGLSPIADEDRSGSPHPTIVSMVSPSEIGWRLVEKGGSGGSSTDHGQGQASSPPRRRISKSGRRRSSSAASSGEAAAAATAGSHIRMASAESATTSPAGQSGTAAVTVSRSRTLPTRTERSSRKDKDLTRDRSTTTRDKRHEQDRAREQEHRHREGREPTSTSGSRETGGNGSGGRNVLKKQKRASMQNQKSATMAGLHVPTAPKSVFATGAASGSTGLEPKSPAAQGGGTS